MNFEGVDSCFYVWINGSYIGYSQVSHMTSEFDVTDVLQDGTNTVAVLVMNGVMVPIWKIRTNSV